MKVHHTVGGDLSIIASTTSWCRARRSVLHGLPRHRTLEPEVAEKIVEGIAEACKHNGCALIGGETAEMPGFYPQGEYDLADSSSAWPRMMSPISPSAGDDSLFSTSRG